MTFLPRSSIMWLLSNGGPARGPPYPSPLASGPAEPWRWAFLDGGPRRVPIPLHARQRPGGAVALLDHRRRSRAAGVALQDEGEPVRQLRHASQEQTTLAREHRAREAALGERASRVTEIRDRRGDVALGRREARHAPRADEVVDARARDQLLDHGQARQGAVVVERDVAAPRGLGRLGVVYLVREPVHVKQRQSHAAERLAVELLHDRQRRLARGDLVAA